MPALGDLSEKTVEKVHMHGFSDIRLKLESDQNHVLKVIFRRKQIALETSQPCEVAWGSDFGEIPESASSRSVAFSQFSWEP